MKFSSHLTSLIILVTLIASPVLADNEKETPDSIAHIRLAGIVGETPIEDAMGLSGEQIASLKSILARFGKARQDDNIKAVIITLGNFSASTAQIEEIRLAIGKVRNADKKVFAHCGSVSLGGYTLLSSADEVNMEPGSSLFITGLHLEGVYVSSLLEKIGIKADFLHMGQYKSAAESLTRTGPSDAARENMNWLLDSLFESITDMIAKSRNMSVEKIKKYIDTGLFDDKAALKAGLIDSIKSRSELISDIKKSISEDIIIVNHYGVENAQQIDMSNPFAIFSLFAGAAKPKTYAGDSIAIIYAEGAITNGYKQPSPFGSTIGVYSGDIRNSLRIATDDDNIKAIILRIDSPGGSAEASEMILNAVKEAQKKKPVIVSMGSVAASGGYYIACTSERIFADSTTITASIGVVGGKLVTTGLWDKVGINFVPYKRGKNSDILSSANAFTESQRDTMKDYMQSTYKTFKGHVISGRKGKLKKPIDQIAGGRVYTGTQALEIGLVDAIGGLADAVEYAADTTGLASYHLRVIPEPKDFMTAFFEGLSGAGEDPSNISLNLTGQPIMKAALPVIKSLDPIRAKAVLGAIQKVQLLHNENVLLMMPNDFIITN